MSNYRENLNNMMCLDIFLMGLSTQEYLNLQSKIVPHQNENFILLSYDVSSIGLSNLKERATDKTTLEKLAKKFAWQIDFTTVFSNDFQALVLTDTARHILWVNKGFELMTGYKMHEAVGRKPNFLQGKNTDEATRMRFRESLMMGKEFSLNITNYRKNGEEYLCKVQIFPLRNTQNQIIHFLALEQEIK
jgi:PAS domain S-box-containing protein